MKNDWLIWRPHFYRVWHSANNIKMIDNNAHNWVKIVIHSEATFQDYLHLLMYLYKCQVSKVQVRWLPPWPQSWPSQAWRKTTATQPGQRYERCVRWGWSVRGLRAAACARHSSSLLPPRDRHLVIDPWWDTEILSWPATGKPKTGTHDWYVYVNMVVSIPMPDFLATKIYMSVYIL